jgi:PAS domain S-box-containing protein
MNRCHPSQLELSEQGQVSWLPTREDAILLLESSGENVFVTDRGGRILFLNPMAQQLMGRGRDVIGASFHDLMGCLLPDDDSAGICPFVQMMRTGEVAMLVSHLWKRDNGSQRELVTSFWPRVHGGERVGAVIVSRDLTVAMEAQRDIQRVAHLAEDAPNPIVEFDAAGAMLYANTAMVELMTQCGALEDGIEVVLPASLPGILRECLRSRTPACRVEHAVAGRIIAWSFFPLGDLEQVRAYGLDITADVALRRAKEAAEESARAKGIFLATMSHELRTPMNGVLGCTQLLQDTSLTDAQRQLIQTMQRSAEALLALVNDILDFSKIEAGKLELDARPFNLRTCVEDTLDLQAARAFGKNLDLAYQMDDGIPMTIEGDSLRLRQVLSNLLSNAIKFTEKGDILIEVKLLSTKSDEAQNHSLLHLHFSVRDTGVGIQPERLARLFKPFSQGDASTARHYGGTGLGLAISKQLVELMGGKMWVESSLGTGSTFHFTINVQAEPQPAPFALAGRQPKLADLRLLIVDDNTTVRRVIAEQVTKWGMIPHCAESPQQALEWLNKGESFDLGVLDLQMSGMDGLALAMEIHKLPGAAMMPLVLLMPLGLHSDMPGSTHIVFAHTVNKPVKPAQLCEMLARALLSPKKADRQEPTSRPGQPLTDKLPLRILLCDDNAINQKVAARILHSIGYEPDLAANGREALDAIDKKPFDLVFMDVMMPEMDGLEATRIIRDRQKDGAAHPNYQSRTVIIAMTAQAMQGDREKCLAAGMDDYLSKPILPKDVRAMIERWGAHAMAATAQAAATTEAAPAAQAVPAAPAEPSTPQLTTDAPKPTTDIPKPKADMSTPIPNAPEAAPEPKITPPAPAPAAESSSEPPVEMDRLNDLTDSNVDSIRELVELFLKQTVQQLAQLEAAVLNDKADEVRRVAHSCAGASATLGMTRFVPLIRELEKQGAAGKLTNAVEVYEKAMREFKNIQQFLAIQLNVPLPSPAAVLT